jgi:condensin complex subunit 1
LSWTDESLLFKARANKSSNKPDTELKEFEIILTEFKQRGTEDQDFEKKVEAKKSIASRRVAKRSMYLVSKHNVKIKSLTEARKGAVKRGKKGKQLSSSEEEEQREVDGNGVEESESRAPTTKKKTVARRGRAVPRATPSSDDDEAEGNSEDEEERPKYARRTAAPRSM